MRRSLAFVLIFVAAAGGFVAGQLSPALISKGHNQTANGAPNFASLGDTYDLLKSKFDGTVDPDKALTGARAGLVSSTGDPYTAYLTPEQTKELNDQLTGTLSGIGAEVGIKSQKLVIVSPISGSPAEKAGLRAGDQIVKIDGKDISDLTLDQAVSKIRGKADTKVTLSVVHDVNTAPVDVEITRAVINVPSVKYSLKPGNIGYIQVTSFGTDTNDKIKAAAENLKAQGATKVILDLRNNPGGYLSAAVGVTSEFLPEGKVVVDERVGGKSREVLKTTGGGSLVGLPMVVLINNGSASASEIVAGALQDAGAATLIGEQSFGKGSVQEITKLASGGEIKITVAHWFTPNGKTIDHVGIKPDTVVKLTTEDYNASRDPQLDQAIQVLQAK